MCTLGMKGWERHFISLVFLSKLSWLNHDKNSGQVPTDRYSTKYLSKMLENYQGHNKQEKYEKFSQQLLKKTWQQNIIWYFAIAKKKTIVKKLRKSR